MRKNYIPDLEPSFVEHRRDALIGEYGDDLSVTDAEDVARDCGTTLARLGVALLLDGRVSTSELAWALEGNRR